MDEAEAAELAKLKADLAAAQEANHALKTQVAQSSEDWKAAATAERERADAIGEAAKGYQTQIEQLQAQIEARAAADRKSALHSAVMAQLGVDPGRAMTVKALMGELAGGELKIDPKDPNEKLTAKWVEALRKTDATLVPPTGDAPAYPPVPGTKFVASDEAPSDDPLAAVRALAKKRSTRSRPNTQG